MNFVPIPNQPLAFNTSRLAGCLCEGPQERVLMRTDDTLRFQVQLDNVSKSFLFDGCVGDELLASPTFANPADWLAEGGWDIQENQTCYTPREFPPGPCKRLADLSFTPTAGTFYVIEVVVLSMGACKVDVYFGGKTFLITKPGTYQFSVQTLGPAHGLRFCSSCDICIARASVKEYRFGVTVELLPEGEISGAVDDFTFATNPERFVITGNTMTVSYPMTYIPNGCYYVRLTDECSLSQISSSPVNVGDHECTVLVQCCNSGDAMGFNFTDFNPEIRLYGKLVRATFDYDTSEDRWSNGKVSRNYADRRRTMELRIDRLGEYGHDFVSTFPLWDRLIIDGYEYIAKAEAYEPEYTDVWDDIAPVIVKLEPKQELVRKVRCAEDDGGCFVPPNYWVENTGPNTDYILTEETNEPIELHANA